MVSHPTQRRASRAPFLAILALALLPAVGSAQQATKASGPADPTMAELSQHNLTMDEMHAWLDAYRAMTSVLKSDPALAGRVSRDARVDGRPMTARIADEPRLVDALATADLTPREYVTITMSYVQAGVADMMLKRDSTAELPDEFNQKNLAFFRENRTELERITQEVQRMAAEVASANRPAPTAPRQMTPIRPQ